MTRFSNLYIDELYELKTSLAHWLGSCYYEANDWRYELMEEIDLAYDIKEKARIDALPHCTYCNQVIPKV